MLQPIPELQETASWKVMQFTGLLDRHGTEIYEEDILRYWQTSTIGKVHWCTSLAAFAVSYRGSEMLASLQPSGNLLSCPSVEIIGNIYEHGHLLDR